MAIYLGIDLGGTNIKAGVVDDSGRVLEKLSVPTEGERGPDAVIASMSAAARDAASQAGIPLAEIDAIGIGSPGPLDLDAGVVIHAPNIPGFDHVPLAARVAEATGRPVRLENDANAAAFGEFWSGAGSDRRVTEMVMITLGTGIGTGLVSGGRILHGSRGYGGEGGHMIIVPDGRPCGCGQRGCLEAYASATNTAERALEALEAHPESTLASTARSAGGELTSEDIFNAAAAGDTLARRIVDETTLYLGIGCVNFCRLLDPHMIVFAGGMTAAGAPLFDGIRAAFAAHTWGVADTVQIVPATLGNDAGFIGAAGVAWDACRNGTVLTRA